MGFLRPIQNLHKNFMEEIKDFQHYLNEYAERFIAYIPDLLGALLLLAIGWWIIKFLLKYLRKLFVRKDYDLALQNFTLNFLEWALKILLFVMFITQLGFQTTSLLAALGAAGLAIGLALQGSLANLAGGVLIILLKPFRLGDWIEVQGVSGSVKDISLFYTKLNTFGNQLVIIPNGQLSNDNIINYSAEKIRRDEIIIGISYESNMKEAKDILVNLLVEQEDILKEPAPEVLVKELADSSVNLSLRFWATNETFWARHWFTIEEAKRRLEHAGISIPFPQRDLHIINSRKEV